MDLRIKQVSQSNSVRVLIIEDDSSKGKLLVDMLSQIDSPITIEVVRTKHSFISMLLQFVPQMVFAKLELGEFSGEEALTFVRRVFPDVPFILYGQEIPLQSQLDLLSIGATDILNELDNIEKLKESIAQARVLHAYSECQITSLRVMSQIRQNIAALEKIRASLGSHPLPGESNFSGSIQSEIDSSISYLQDLGERLREEAD